ncbi:hypothetical protein ScPMuIL_013008 [Solemya velum]
MNQRSPIQPYLSNSLAIRQEIQRFESVHPSIYAIYDLIDAIPDPLIQQQIREHVVCIEDSFVNSQEWTLSRSVPDLKLGILGSVQSGKSALVHRYLTGSYMQEESPEGGRFKKEVIIDGQSYLLLIRDEGGAPEMQFTHWVDAIIFVFSLENEMSFQAVYSYYAKMAHYRNSVEIPLILVGTQDAISENNPRVIDDTRARKLANDLKRCSYYETCATYGLNVERVFQDACQKIVQMRYPSLPSHVPSTPNHSQRAFFVATPTNKPYDTHSNSSQSTSSSGTLVQPAVKEAVPKEKEMKPEKSEKAERKKKEHHHHHSAPVQHPSQAQTQPPPHPTTQPPPSQSQLEDQEDRCELRDLTHSTPLSARKSKKSSHVQKSNSFSGATDFRLLANQITTPVLGRKNSKFYKPNFLTDRLDKCIGELPTAENSQIIPFITRIIRVRSSLVLDRPDGKDLPTPSSTPTQGRKNRRRSNLFNPKKGEEEKKTEGEKLGSGRVIPLRQGYLYKKSHGLNKEWKKKYVTLCDNGRLTYHCNLHDYMDDVHGKEINLVHTTVKVPGQFRPRAPRNPPAITQDSTNGISQEMNNLSIGIKQGKVLKDKENVLLTGYDPMRDLHPHIDEAAILSRKSSTTQAIPNGETTGGGGGGGSTGGGVSGGGGGGGSGFAMKMGISNLGSNKLDTPNVKKRHRRAKSGGLKTIDPGAGDDSDGYEFIIVSLDNKQWHFEAQNHEERDCWVGAIEQQILNSLQGNESSKSKKLSTTDPAGIQAVKNVAGNNGCVDCGAPNPDWASINLGVLVCIECSGIHRSLGTDVSRVRSLDLDEWQPDLISVMMSIGNTTSNTVWEANTKGRPKPSASSPRDEKERWIRSKYCNKEFVPPPPYLDIPLNQQLIDALVREDIRNIVLVLGHSRPDDINAPYSKDDGRTALHIAAALGNVVFVQLLLWYNANVKVVDHEGRNALWYARSSGSMECVELLMNNGCPEHPTLPRRRPSAQAGKNDVFEKLPASVI